ncbi:MAG: GTPase Era, partial [Clostridia bacterium]|nr:GTPase Era [Clostridia bacterium]
MKRTGFISIVGRPNVGKSTLLNSILGEKIAIVSNKPQTTRNRIAGIETRGEDQFVFLDTPGIFKPQNSLGDFMVKTANSTMQEGDMVILVADAGYRPGEVEEGIVAYLKKSETPAILALNKVDLYRREQIAETIAAYAAIHNFEAVVPISAKKGKYVNEVLDECSKLLREGEWFYDEDMITDQPQRQMVAEIIREKILRTLDKEIPHGVAIVVEEYRDEGSIVRIRAEIFCEKASHKG